MTKVSLADKIAIKNKMLSGGFYALPKAGEYIVPTEDGRLVHVSGTPRFYLILGVEKDERDVVPGSCWIPEFQTEALKGLPDTYWEEMVRNCRTLKIPAYQVG